MLKRKLITFSPLIVLLGVAVFLTVHFLAPRFRLFNPDENMNHGDLSAYDEAARLHPEIASFDTVETEEKEYEFTTICDTLRRGESIFYVLLDHGIDGRYIHELIQEFTTIFDVKRSFPGDICTAALDSAGTIRHFEYRRDEKEIYVVEKQNGGFVSFRKEIEGVRLARAVEGEIRTSLYEAMTGCGLGAELIFAYADIFAWDVDFYVDVRVGDRFRLLFEQCCIEEKVLEYGRVLAAEYIGEEASCTAVWFEDSTGYGDYYDLEGQSMRKTFLKSPFKYGYKRISSGFSWSRLHPIRKVRRPHLGIDYAAPTGTPVISTADGAVEYAGWKNGFGKYVEIRHGGGMQTTYGHLSRYGGGIRKGARVRQGQVIGYVGATGLATGPHLDYRFIKNGRYVNPLNVSVPTANPVKEEFLNDFELAARNLPAAMNLLLALPGTAPQDTVGSDPGEAMSISSVPDSTRSQ